MGDLKDAFAMAKAVVKKDYKEELAKAQMEARKRMHIRLRSLEKGFDMKGGGERDSATGYNSPKAFAHGDFKRLLIEQVQGLKSGYQFTCSELFQQIKKEDPKANYRSINAALSRVVNKEKGSYAELSKLLVSTGKKKGAERLYERIEA